MRSPTAADVWADGDSTGCIDASPSASVGHYLEAWLGCTKAVMGFLFRQGNTRPIPAEAEAVEAPDSIIIRLFAVRMESQSRLVLSKGGFICTGGQLTAWGGNRNLCPLQNTERVAVMLVVLLVFCSDAQSSLDCLFFPRCSKYSEN